MVSDTEMNEFVKLNPEYAQDFYKQMRDKYKHTGTVDLKIEMRVETWHVVPSPDGPGVWLRDPLKHP